MGSGSSAKLGITSSGLGSRIGGAAVIFVSPPGHRSRVAPMEIAGWCASVGRVIDNAVLIKGCIAVIAEDRQPALVAEVADLADRGRFAAGVERAQLHAQGVAA